MVGDFNASPASQISVEVEFLHEDNGNLKKYYFLALFYVPSLFNTASSAAPQIPMF